MKFAWNVKFDVSPGASFVCLGHTADTKMFFHVGGTCSNGSVFQCHVVFHEQVAPGVDSSSQPHAPFPRDGSAFFVPLAIYAFDSRVPVQFYLLGVIAGLNEGIRIFVFFAGVRRDYYSTYSLTGLSPLFVLLMAPGILQEKVNFLLVAGIFLTSAGGVIFYRLGRFMPHGLYCAFASALSGIIAKSALRMGSPLVYPLISFVTASTFIYVIMRLRGMVEEPPFSRDKVFATAPLSFLSFAASVLNYTAISLAPITKVNPLIRTNLLFGFVFSYFIAGEKENAMRRLIAGVLIFAGVLCIIKA